MKKYILIVAIFFTAGITGCKKNYLDLENNPNAPSVTTPGLTLAGALNTTAFIVVNDYEGYGIWAGYWTTSGNYVPNQTINQFQLTNTSLNGDWNDWYGNLTNYNLLQQLAAKDPSLSNYQAIAMIMKAYGFQHLVDDFNDVPYTQAFNGISNLFPAYDKGVDIYHDLGKQLDAAIALIQKGGGASPGSYDIVFGGAMDSWIKFANSLKLRLAMRVSTKLGLSDPLVTDLAATASLGYLDGSTQAIANPGYANTAGKQNPFWGTYGFDATGNPTFGNVYNRANTFSVSMLKSFNDPRLGEIYAPTTGGWPAIVINGNTFGDNSSADLQNPGTSAIGPGLLQSAGQGAYLFSGAESLFLQAEAELDGAVALSLTPQQLYEAGITASFIQTQAGGSYTPVPADSKGNAITTSQSLQSANFTYTAPTAAQSTAAAVTYYSQAINNVGWAASTNKETAIITQKWIALNGYFNMEGWNEYRRTGIPILPSSIDPAAVSSTLPTRVLYPLSELTTNAANLAKEGTIDVFHTKIFWAK